MTFVDPNILSGPCPHFCMSYSPKGRSTTVFPIHLLRENIWRVVFVLHISSGCLALCQKYHSEKL